MQTNVPSSYSDQEDVPPYRRYTGETVTLGLNFMGHDISYTLLADDGTPVLIAEEERYSRRKKGTFVPSPRHIYQILEEAGVAPEAVSHIAIANIPELIEQRPLVTTSGRSVPFGVARCFSSLFRAISTRLCDPDSVIWLRHHLCHAASAFLPSPFESAAVVTVDGMGEDETATIWHGDGTTLTKRFSIRHPHSLGYVYQAIAQWAGMLGAEREGKLMGLASLGQPRFLPVFREHFLRLDPKGGFVAAPNLAARPCDNLSWIAYCEQHFGPQRAPESELTQHHMDVAASVQALLEDTLLDLLRFAARLTNARYCCVAGGVFMNSMANGRLRREGPFEDLWVQPMSSDNGLSLGAALWSYARRHPDHDRWRMTTPFLGSDITEQEIQSLLRHHAVNAHRSEHVPEETANLLAAGKLVGWVQGRSEVGARALGHRSIFADPRDPQSKDRLNARIKLREDWRPFAPIVLEEDAAELFLDPRPSPFMMSVTPVLPAARIPAALHVDGTARVQTVNALFDARLYRLLQAFKELTGVGALVNTSFNVRGEPIVRTAEEAYRDFINSGMDALVLGDYIIEKPVSSEGASAPLNAPPPRVLVADQFPPLIRSSDSSAIVSLGSQNFLAAVKHAISDVLESTGLSHLFMPPPIGALDYPLILSELYSSDDEIVPITKLASYDLLFLLLPTWVEIAADLIPNLLDPFVNLLQQHPTLRIFVLDEAGAMEPLSSILRGWERSGSHGASSEVENFWLFRRV